VARHVAKFRGVTHPNPKVIGANMLNFKPIFDQPCKRIVKETPVASGL